MKQQRTRIKICGITRSEDAQAAIAAGVDALGFVFFEQSPRHIVLDDFMAIVRQLPPFVCKTALFVNAEVAEVNAVLATGYCDLLQFHGDESVAYCEQFGRPYIKAVRVKDAQSVRQAEQDFVSASALLLDAFDEKLFGGTGQAFDWSLVKPLLAKLQKPLVVAGGLHAGNVAEAIALLQPYAVDVSGGVEAEQDGKRLHGVKNADKIRAFVNEVRRVE